MFSSFDVFTLIVSFLDYRSIHQLAFVNHQFNTWYCDVRLWNYLLKHRYSHLPSSCHLFGTKQTLEGRRLFQAYETRTNIFLDSNRTEVVSTNDDLIIAGTILGYQVSHLGSKDKIGSIYEHLPTYIPPGKRENPKSILYRIDPLMYRSSGQSRIEYVNTKVLDYTVVSTLLEPSVGLQVDAVCQYYQVKVEVHIFCSEEEVETYEERCAELGLI